MEKCGRTGQLTYHYITRRMPIACRIPKDIDTHLAYVKVIAFPQQQWLRERPSNLRYTYLPLLSHYVKLRRTGIFIDSDSLIEYCKFRDRKNTENFICFLCLFQQHYRIVNQKRTFGRVVITLFLFGYHAKP